ncbi:MAG TPA: OmpA family protein [Candidatus Edwardsbacteria bacterium]|nr:OmpA family protein [Candidatus Edwardsbacteria bacterium]
MKNSVKLLAGVSLVCAMCGLAMAADPDVPGGKDHPLLSRMPNFHVSEYKEKDFDSYKFLDAGAKAAVTEGHFYHLQYNLDRGAAQPGELKVRRNIQDALKKIGGRVVFDDNFNKVSTIVLKRDGKETWVEVRSFNNMYRLTIVERQAMAQEVTANAEAMGNDIGAAGHVAVYGIYFDTGKAAIKPESDAALNEVAKMLRNNSGLAVYVVGHTDNTGSFEANITLSQERAEAVVARLSDKFGIGPDRMKARGVASLAPVASNDSEEGRAKNRRVELVKQ